MHFSSTSQSSIGAAPVGGIGCEPLRLETEALLCSLDPSFCRTTASPPAKRWSAEP